MTGFFTTRRIDDSLEHDWIGCRDGSVPCKRALYYGSAVACVFDSFPRSDRLELYMVESDFDLELIYWP